LSSTGDDPRHWRVLVADEGIGFPPERADLIFQPFRRLVGSAFEGSGIGMASAKKIVRLQGGTISAVGRLGEGATFTVVLPRAESPPKLLIVDDDDLELQVASGALAGCGFEILTACSGEEALKIVGETSVHTVLTDYQMLGGEHGIWLLERVRAIRPQTRRLLTSSIEIAGLAEVKRSGLVHDFFAKTVTAEQLLACQPPACQVVESASSSATGQGRMAS
jgi:CheY-like chemotaxis protein